MPSKSKSAIDIAKSAMEIAESSGNALGSRVTKTQANNVLAAAKSVGIKTATSKLLTYCSQKDRSALSESEYAALKRVTDEAKTICLNTDPGVSNSKSRRYWCRKSAAIIVASRQR